MDGAVTALVGAAKTSPGAVQDIATAEGISSERLFFYVFSHLAKWKKTDLVFFFITIWGMY